MEANIIRMLVSINITPSLYERYIYIGYYVNFTIYVLNLSETYIGKNIKEYDVCSASVSSKDFENFLGLKKWYYIISIII